MNVPNDAFPCTGYEGEIVNLSENGSVRLGHPRLPWTHKSKSGPDDFHFAKVLPRTNHLDVPL